jgi:hypothetical protein
MHGREVSASEVSVAGDALCVYREADWENQARGVCYSSEGKGGFVADGKELERNSKTIGK